MSMDICLQVVIAPVILKWFSRGSRALVCFCAILLCVSMWVSPLVAKHGFRLYFVVTMFLTDIPAAVLQLAFSTFPTDTFSSTEKEFAVKMQNYTKKVIKQWQPVFFMMLQYQFPEHAGLTRVFGFPLALGVGIYGLTSRFGLSAATIVVGYAVLVLTSPTDDEGMFGALNLLSGVEDSKLSLGVANLTK
ncbi:unnamed protein product [Trypanosoma congolense IL3000]|uniref:WGS project CAEQ00000000 data, annotated contig 237 n=1 Tax=Trypanosoma congolense (strain IL3000) TaxID=1068625 RepID=F9WDJ5_TRYCI|nr:unnamed protein product [Trypanosoma congolense IL3000]